MSPEIAVPGDNGMSSERTAPDENEMSLEVELTVPGANEVSSELSVPDRNEMSPSPFLHLPPEIRLEVYRYLLLSKHTIRMTRQLDYHFVFRPNFVFPAILRTCKLIHSEAMTILYGENLFRAHRIDDTNRNFALIQRAKFIVGYRHSEDGAPDASKLALFLNTHLGLRHLELHINFDLLEDDEIYIVLLDTLCKSLYTSSFIVTLDSKNIKSHLKAMVLMRVAGALQQARDMVQKASS